MPSQYQRAQQGLARAAKTTASHAALWGFSHVLTNGRFLPIDDSSISYVQLKTATPNWPTMDYETDCEEYYLQVNEKAVEDYLAMLQGRILGLSALEACEYLFRKIKQRFRRNGVTVSIGGKMDGIIDESSKIVKTKIVCCLCKSFEALVIIS